MKRIARSSRELNMLHNSTMMIMILIIVIIMIIIKIILKVVQEYERAVIFRLGRLLNGGAKGPGQ